MSGKQIKIFHDLEGDRRNSIDQMKVQNIRNSYTEKIRNDNFIKFTVFSPQYIHSINGRVLSGAGKTEKIYE